MTTRNMKQTHILIRQISDWTSDAFGVLVYRDARADAWTSAAELVAGAGRVRAPRLQVTSPDGLLSTFQSREAFFSRVHDEQLLTISADWFTDDHLDGYVTATLNRADGVHSEFFTFGTLNDTQTTFTDALLERFEQLHRRGIQALLAVKTGYDSTPDTWRRYYLDHGNPPQADFLGVPVAWFTELETRAKLLDRTSLYAIFDVRDKGA
jgi:hypothetical protein